MNKIPKGNNKKLLPFKINKKLNKELVCEKIKTKIFSNRKIIRSFGKDITNISTIKENSYLTKKSSSYNDKVS